MIIVSKVKSKCLKYRGFSLVELSVSLAIISMIVGSALSVAITNDFATKKLETERKLDRIEEALAGFLAFNLRLPCPANGTTLISDATFGQEGTLTPAAGGTNCPNSNLTDYGISPYSVTMGVVPVDTLQLPDDFMFDGWGRRISYFVVISSINNYTTNTTCINGDDNCFANIYGSIEIADPNSYDDVTYVANYVLLSHGENGHGAFLKNGSPTRLNGFPLGNPYRDSAYFEQHNAAFDINGVDIPLGLNTFFKGFDIKKDDLVSARVYFDDIVRFKVKSLLVKEAGAVLFDETCKIAENVVNNPGANDCTGVVGEEDCEAFAIEIYQRCLK